jgi:hypothetical protein
VSEKIPSCSAEVSAQLATDQFCARSSGKRLIISILQRLNFPSCGGDFPTLAHELLLPSVATTAQPTETTIRAPSHALLQDDSHMPILTNAHGPAEALQSRPGSATRAPRILIIVPAYNESKSLPDLLHSLRNECPGCDVVVVDDGSSDGTRGAIAGLARVVSLPCNLGIGAAVQTGLQIALREGYDFAMQVDGDGQHPASEISKLLAALHESSGDLVVGTRFRSEEGFKSTAVRRMGIRVFSSLLSGICRTSITDPTSGFRVFSRRAIRLLAPRYSEDFPEVEALVVAHRAGLHIVEVPVVMSKRTAGRSSIGPLKSLVYMLKVPLAVFMGLLRKPEVNS